MNKYITDKHQKLSTYIFPEDYTISLHHSHLNTDTLFQIRLGSLLYLTAVYIWSMIMTQSLLINIIFLTMNGYFLTWLYFLLVVQDYYLNSNSSRQSTNGFPMSNRYRNHKQYHSLKYYIEFVYQIAWSVQLPITLVFWGVLFKILLNMEGITLWVAIEIAVNANLHAGPLFCLFLDLLYNTCKFPRRHFWGVIISSFLYMLVNLAYSLAVKPVYKPIDWISVFSYILLIVSIILSYANHWLGRLFFRHYKKKKLQNRIIEGLIGSGYSNSLNNDKNQQNDEQGGRQNKRSRQNLQQLKTNDNNDLNVSVITDD